MDNTMTYQIIATPAGNVTIIRSDGACIPADLRNSDYAQYLVNVTPEQAALDEATAIAQAQADAQAKAEAEATAQANFTAQLAATNAKLEALGLTAQDIGTLLNAAKA